MKQNTLRPYPVWVPYAFLAPFFAGFVVFYAIPIGFGFYISLTRWTGFGKPVFVGLANYAAMLSDQLFYVALGNTFIIVLLFVPVIVGIGLVMAYLLFSGFVQRRQMFQTLFFSKVASLPGHSACDEIWWEVRGGGD